MWGALKGQKTWQWDVFIFGNGLNKQFKDDLFRRLFCMNVVFINTCVALHGAKRIHSWRGLGYGKSCDITPVDRKMLKMYLACILLLDENIVNIYSWKWSKGGSIQRARPA